MSRDSFAALRKNSSGELAALAEEHLKHDLQQSDRDALREATRQVSTYATVGSVLGLGLSIALAFRVRAGRAASFNALKSMERPTQVQFASGRTEPLPDVAQFVKPSRVGDAATYFFFSISGLFLGGELGLLAGSGAATRTISRDPESRKRIDRAFRRFRVDVLKKEIQQLEAGESNLLL